MRSVSEAKGPRKPRQLSFFTAWSSPPEPGSPPGTAAPLGARRGVEYYDLPCRAVLNRCTSKRMPFQWTLNPYRGCEFGCTYCYARYTHGFLGMEKWTDFQDKVLVKRTAPARLARELESKSGRDGTIALGTVTDPYQPAEREFGVTRRILEVLAARRGLDLSVTTKSALLLRDLDLLRRIAERSRLRINISLISLDRRIARILEPRAPTPRKRLQTVRALARAGLDVGIFAMPVLPGLTDSPRCLDDLIRRCADAGARRFAAQLLFLRGTAREGFLPRLEAEFPVLARRYRRAYARSSRLGPRAHHRLRERVAALTRRHGLGAGASQGPCVPETTSFPAAGGAIPRFAAAKDQMSAST